MSPSCPPLSPVSTQRFGAPMETRAYPDASACIPMRPVLPQVAGIVSRTFLPILALCLVGCVTQGQLTPTPPVSPTPPPIPVCVRTDTSRTLTITDAGRMQVVQAFPSTALGNTRSLRIYLPPSYDAETSRSYPVLYMHDGQNLFSASTAAFGVEWQVDETLDQLYAEQVIEELIVVGIDNTSDRLGEYTPSKDAEGRGGKGDVYARFIAGEVKPWIDSNYRTQCEAENTAVMGSSLGGLISFYMGWNFPDHFSMAGALSTSLWWDERELLKEIQAYSGHRIPVQFWVDTGTGEGDDEDGNGLSYMVEDSRTLRDRLLSLGHQFEEDLGYQEQYGAGHNETAWASRFQNPALFFFGIDQNPPVSALSLTLYGTEVGVSGLTKIPLEVNTSYENGLSMTVPNPQAGLVSQQPMIASVDAQGWITGVSVGEAMIIATYQGKSDETVIPVREYVSNNVAFTLSVEVPETTPDDAIVYISGSIAEVGGWDPAKVALTRRDASHWYITLDLPRGQQFEYKFTRGSWSTVEKDESCAEITNRISQAAPVTEEMTVANWADKCP